MVGHTLDIIHSHWETTMGEEQTWEKEVVRWMKDIRLVMVGARFHYYWVR